MDKGYEAVRDLVAHIFPTIPQILNENDFLNKKYNPPCVFIETQKVSENGHSNTARSIIVDAGLKFFFPKKTNKGTVEYEKIDVSPFSDYLYKNRYTFVSHTANIGMMIRRKEITNDTSQPDSVEIIFRFEYLDKYEYDEIERINEFTIVRS